MHNKKAIELSLNFIVTIIISIVIFSFGIWFISSLVHHANDLKDLTVKDLEDRIGDLVCQGSERVCIGNDRKIIPRTKLDVFGLKVMNIMDSQQFTIIVTASNPMGFTKEKQPINNGPPLELKYQTTSVLINQNDEHNFAIGVQVSANAASGTYIFNVDIKKEDETSYVGIQKFYVEVP